MNDVQMGNVMTDVWRTVNAQFTMLMCGLDVQYRHLFALWSCRVYDSTEVWRKPIGIYDDSDIEDAKKVLRYVEDADYELDAIKANGSITKSAARSLPIRDNSGSAHFNPWGVSIVVTGLDQVICEHLANSSAQLFELYSKKSTWIDHK